MSQASCLRRLRAHLLLPIMAGLAWPAYAQSPPVPNFSVAFEPDLAVNVWPADFNRDGRTDLIAATGRTFPPSTQLTVAIGRGNGSFFPARPLGIPAIPLGVGDMNEDGFVDVIIRRGDSLEVLPGRGDGTFSAPRAVATTQGATDEVRTWGYVVDLDSDGHRDIVVPERFEMCGGIAGTATSPSSRPSIFQLRGGGYQSSEATSGDFNGDGRRDLAVASPNGIDVFLNQGGTAFTHSAIDSAAYHPLTDLTTRDINNDGKLDLDRLGRALGPVRDLDRARYRVRAAR